MLFELRYERRAGTRFRFISAWICDVCRRAVSSSSDRLGALGVLGLGFGVLAF